VAGRCGAHLLRGRRRERIKTEDPEEGAWRPVDLDASQFNLATFGVQTGQTYRCKDQKLTSIPLNCQKLIFLLRDAFSAVLSTEGRVVELCWAKLKPKGPKGPKGRARFRCDTLEGRVVGLGPMLGEIIT